MGWDRATWTEVGWTLSVSAAAVGLVLFSALGHPAPFWSDDVETQYLPLTREVYKAAMRGDLALVTPKTWAGGAIAGEFQQGMFSPVIVGVDVLAWACGSTLRSVATIMACVWFGVLAAGTFRFARAEQMERVPALLAVVATVANGWMLEWAVVWFPVLVSFAWIPWLGWALHRRSNQARTLAVALFLWFILASGWPWSVLLAAVVIAWMVGRHWLETRSLSPVLGSIAIGSLLATMLAAPALLSVFEYGKITERVAARGTNHEWVVPLNALPAVIWPAWIAEWPGWDVVKSRTGVELANGAVPVLVLLAAWKGRGGSALLRAAAPYLLLALVAIVLAMSPAAEPFRKSFRWLPLFHLAIGLAAARAVPELEAARDAVRVAPLRSRLLLNAGILGILLTVPLAWNTWSLGLARARADTFTVASLGLFCLLAVGIEAGSEGFRRALLPAISAAWQLTALALTPTPEVPHWELSEALRSPGPMDPRRTHLLLGRFNEFNGKREMCRPGNVPLLSDLTFVNGYSPFSLSGMFQLFGFDIHGSVEDVGWVTQEAAKPGNLLDLLGIDALVLPQSPRFEPAYAALDANGWRRSATLDGCVIHDRGGPPAPRAWSVPFAQVVKHFEDVGRIHEDASLSMLVGGLEPTPGPVTFARHVKVDPAFESDRRMDLDVENAEDVRGLVVVKRAYYPGYRAWLDGKPLAVGAYDGVLVAVVIPPLSRGRLEVVYEPRLLGVGYFVAAGGLVLAIAVLALGGRAARHHIVNLESSRMYAIW
jgi:hypothetical protein